MCSCKSLGESHQHLNILRFWPVNNLLCCRSDVEIQQIDVRVVGRAVSRPSPPNNTSVELSKKDCFRIMSAVWWRTILNSSQIFSCYSRTESLPNCVFQQFQTIRTVHGNCRPSSLIYACTIGNFALINITKIFTLAPLCSFASILSGDLEVNHFPSFFQWRFWTNLKKIFVCQNKPVHKILFLLTDAFTELPPLLLVCFIKWLHGSNSKKLGLGADSQHSPWSSRAERQIWCSLS